MYFNPQVCGGSHTPKWCVGKAAPRQSEGQWLYLDVSCVGVCLNHHHIVKWTTWTQITLAGWRVETCGLRTRLRVNERDKGLVIKMWLKNSALCFVFNLVMINALMLTAIIIIHFNRLSKRQKWLIPISFSPTCFFFSFFFFYWLLCHCWHDCCLIILNSAVIHGHSFIFKPTYEPAWIRSLWRKFCVYLSTLLTLAMDSETLTGSTSCQASSVLL